MSFVFWTHVQRPRILFRGMKFKDVPCQVDMSASILILSWVAAESDSAAIHSSGNISIHRIITFWEMFIFLCMRLSRVHNTHFKHSTK